jgi:hypothetical protein
MIGEIDLYGIYLPPLLVWAFIAQIIATGLHRVLSGLGLYRYVWHRPLFDFSLLIILTGLVDRVMNYIF